jgi:hypothetical protein
MPIKAIVTSENRLIRFAIRDLGLQADCLSRVRRECAPWYALMELPPEVAGVQGR